MLTGSEVAEKLYTLRDPIAITELGNDFPDFRPVMYGLQITLGLMGEKRDITRVRGKKILDLGCGSRYTEKHRDGEGYIPFFALLCSALGATVVGLDINNAYPADACHYKHIRADLVEIVRSRTFTKVVGTGYDLINSDIFLRDGTPGLSTLLAFAEMSEIELISSLKEQSKESLSPRGIFVIDCHLA